MPIAQTSARSVRLCQIARQALADLGLHRARARAFGASVSAGGMPRSIHAEKKNENASSRIANGAVSHWISAPGDARARSSCAAESRDADLGVGLDQVLAARRARS